MPERSETHAMRGWAPWLWVGMIAVGSLGLSRMFACAMPLAALAAYAAWSLPFRKAVTLVLVSWLGNQAVGFGLLHYPHTGSTVGWGVAIGVAALVSLLGAQAVLGRGVAGAAIRMPLVLAVAFASYEAALAAATLLLPSGPDAFGLPVMLRILAINAVALGLLLAIDRAARLSGLRVSKGLATTAV